MQGEENRDTKNLPSEIAEGADGRVYELGYLLKPTLLEGNALIGHTWSKDLIVSQGGEIISDEMPKVLALAYTMWKVTQNVRSKFDTAYFGWIKFEIDPEKILELKNKLGIKPDFVRFLILKTVRENTIATRRFIQKDFRKKAPIVKKEERDGVSIINKEEIDKEIDAMVAV